MCILFPQQIQKTVDDVTGIKQDIQDYGKDLKVVSCLAKLAIKIEDVIVSFPKYITKDVDGFVDIIQNIQLEIEQCGSDGIEYCIIQRNAFLTNIEICVARKIINQNLI